MDDQPKLKYCGIEEDDTCFRKLPSGVPCLGTMVFTKVEGCTCHCGHPPCSACTRQLPTCNNCGCSEEDD